MTTWVPTVGVFPDPLATAAVRVCVGPIDLGIAVAAGPVAVAVVVAVISRWSDRRYHPATLGLIAVLGVVGMLGAPLWALQVFGGMPASCVDRQIGALDLGDQTVPAGLVDTVASVVAVVAPVLVALVTARALARRATRRGARWAARWLWLPFLAAVVAAFAGGSAEAMWPGYLLVAIPAAVVVGVLREPRRPREPREPRQIAPPAPAPTRSSAPARVPIAERLRAATVGERGAGEARPGTPMRAAPTRIEPGAPAPVRTPIARVNPPTRAYPDGAPPGAAPLPASTPQAGPPAPPAGPDRLAAAPGPLPASLAAAIGGAIGAAAAKRRGPAPPTTVDRAPGAPGDDSGDRFRRIRRLGEGGFGHVWLARDTLLGRDVAIKVAKASDEQTAMRIRREARALAAVHHPHCVRIYDILPDVAGLQGLAIVMEYVPGRSLSALVTEDGVLGDTAGAHLWSTLAGALAAAHARGVLHRDVKPSNVIVDESGRAHLIDFGIARSSGDVTMTATGMVIGTPDFMAPEVAAGGDADPATDTWQLAATVSYALSGHPPRGWRPDAMSALRAAADGDPPNQVPFRSAHRDLLLRAMDPIARRRPSAAAVQAELSGRLARGGGPTTGSVTRRM